jgi:CRP/FNR family cyclic AMP-dependent transcriptional regulator
VSNTDIVFLKNVPMFAGLSEEDLNALAASFRTRSYKKRDVLVFEGDVSDSLFLVTRGHVAVTQVNTEGKETVLSILKEGGVFGEMGVLDGAPRSASVVALRDVQALMLPRDAFLDLLERRPGMHRTVISGLCGKLRATNRSVQAISHLKMRERLAYLLLRLEKNFGEIVESGTRLNLKLTHQQIANMIGGTRETVNRTLMSFWEERLIDMRSAHIIIPDISKLAGMVA